MKDKGQSTNAELPRRCRRFFALRPSSVILFVCLLLVHSACAGDWPQILGPSRSGVAQGERLARSWPPGGPKILWQRNVGQGYAGAAVADGRVVLFHRVGDDEVTEALDADSGQQQWEARTTTHYVSSIDPDSGPRCVPLIHEGFVYVFGAAGRLSCISLAGGKIQWSRDTWADFDAPSGYFGAGSSPIVEGDKLLVGVGGRNRAGIVAFALATGATLWRSTDEQASYSSPVAATIDGVRHVIVVMRLNVLSIDPSNGQVRFRIPFGSRGPTVNAASPVVMGRHVFLSANYGVGAALLRINGQKAEIAWQNDAVMSSQYMTSVFHDGVLYGIDGRADLGTCRLRAFDPRTGKIHWTREDYGMATMLVADGVLVIVKTNGELVLVRPSPDRYQEIARTRLAGTTFRALPALADGKLYVRDTRHMVCVDVGIDAEK